jgi:hypothetical protein
MDRYLVEVHVEFDPSSAAQGADLERRLVDHDDVLADPPPLVAQPDADAHTVFQFTVEGENQTVADKKGEGVAKAILEQEDADAATSTITLVSARLMDKLETP